VAPAVVILDREKGGRGTPFDGFYKLFEKWVFWAKRGKENIAFENGLG